MALNKNAKKWVRALKSGKYHQTKEVLHKEGGGYCCLGVACEVYQKSVGDLDLGVTVGGCVVYDGYMCSLPKKVREWLGLRTATGEFRGDDLVSLVEMNDDGKRFKTIAKLIESEPEGLFE